MGEKFMHREQRARAHQRLQSVGIAHALFANVSSVRWLTGFAPPVQLGPNIFAGGPPLVWYEEGQFTLIVVDGQAGSAGDFAQEPDCELVTYLGYTIERPIHGGDRLAEALRAVLPSGPVSVVGVEANDVTARVVQLAQERLGDDVALRTIDGWLEPLRMIKSEEEIGTLRENFLLTDLAHAAARRAVAPGKREIDVWNEICAAVQSEAGQRVPVGNDCVVGYRENNIGGWPADLKIGAEDSVIVDLSTVLHGYWSDSCATYYAGEPNERQIQMHRMAENALEYAISLVRPGAVAREIDAQVRQFVVDAGYPVYPHHTGHGVGVTGHEGPRIVPYCEDVIEEGMIIMLEPGTYIPGVGGVRLEDAMLVTADGVELLTHHDKSLP
jgi:Xaa-Pro aminopeptidase